MFSVFIWYIGRRYLLTATQKEGGPITPVTASINQEPQELLASGKYTLRPGVYFIEGAKNSTLCDTNTGIVYSVNELGKTVIRNEKHSEKFWGNLEKIGLATRIRVESKVEFVMKPASLNFVWFEIISDDCDMRCVHCYADCMPSTYKRQLTEEKNPLLDITQNRNVNEDESRLSADRLDYTDWLELISQIYDLGCRQCQFIGGEPFLYRGDNGKGLLDLALYAKNLGYEFIEIFSNGTLITANKVNLIKKMNLHVAISLYSIREKVHETITRTPGSFRKTIRALELLKFYGVPTRVETVVMKENQNYVEETVQWIDQMGFSHKHPDLLRPKGRGDNSDLQPNEEVVIKRGLITKPNFHAQKDFFERNVSGNSCLAGKIVITEFGDVLPCIFSRNYKLGNIFKQPLTEVVKSVKLREVWDSTKNDVLVCRDCEYRFVCFDCRSISDAANKSIGDYLTTPYPRCTYNPYRGEWGGGVWRLNIKGEVYYDTTMQNSIQALINQEINSSDI